YIGDNGFHTCEEVDFIRSEWIYPVSTNLPDYGWPAREGIFAPVPSANSFVRGLPTNTGSLYPIIARTAANLDANVDITGDGVPDAHGDGDDSVIGGCVYRGPVGEFYGKYIYADFVGGRVYCCAFNRDTNPALFSGSNVTGFAEIRATLEATLPGAVLDSVVSFYADAAGDLYLANYGSSAGAGAVYKLVAVPPPALGRPEFGNNQFSFVVTGAIGESYVVEVSTNLQQWSATATNSGIFTNVDGSVDHCCRLVETSTTYDSPIAPV